MRRRNWPGLGCAAIIGAVIAFPAGVIFARHQASPEKASPPNGIGIPPGTAVARNPYFPSISRDPYVLDRQQMVVEALEAQCRDRKKLCSEAEQARRRLNQQEAAH